MDSLGSGPLKRQTVLFPPQEAPMPSTTDAKLVELIRNPKTPVADQKLALRELDERTRRIVIGSCWAKVFNPQAVLAALGHTDVADLVADVIADAVRAYDASKGAKFSTFACRIFHNRVVDAFKGGVERDLPIENEEGEIPHEDRKGRGLPPGSEAVLREAREQARACTRTLPEREGTLLGMRLLWRHGYEEIHDLLPQESLQNLRQIVSRAVKAWLKEWVRRGGEDIQDIIERFALVMRNDMSEDRIRNKDAREAYEAWRKADHNAVKAARALKKNPEEVRRLVFDGLSQALEGVFRRGRIDRERVGLLGDEVGDLFLLCEESGQSHPLYEHIQRTFAVVRAAFGLEPLENVCHTLGSFVQSRLASEADYARAAENLKLTPSALRRLLDDRGEVDDGLYKRLSQFLEEPVERLHELPRGRKRASRTVERSHQRFDEKRYFERLETCLRTM